MQHRLTQSPTLHFLRRDRKDSEYLDHDLDNHVGHGCSRCNVRIYLKPVKEMLDVSLSRLAWTSLAACKSGYQNRSCKRAARETDQEKNADPRKDYVGWWECLKSKY